MGSVVSISDLNSDLEIKFSKLIHKQVPQIAGLQGIIISLLPLVALHVLYIRL